jgi:hypothetical protein
MKDDCHPSVLAQHSNNYTQGHNIWGPVTPHPKLNLLVAENEPQTLVAKNLAKSSDRFNIRWNSNVRR